MRDNGRIHRILDKQRSDIKHLKYHKPHPEKVHDPGARLLCNFEFYKILQILQFVQNLIVSHSRWRLFWIVLGHLRLMPIRCRLGIQKCLHSVKSPNKSKCTAVSRVQEGSILELFVAFWRFSGTSKHTWKVEEVDFSGFKGRGPWNSKIRFSFVAISSCGSTWVSGG